MIRVGNGWREFGWRECASHVRVSGPPAPMLATRRSTQTQRRVCVEGPDRVVRSLTRRYGAAWPLDCLTEEWC